MFEGKVDSRGFSLVTFEKMIELACGMYPQLEYLQSLVHFLFVSCCISQATSDTRSGGLDKKMKALKVSYKYL